LRRIGLLDAVQATAEQWLSLRGSGGKTKARLNFVTGELVIRDRGINHERPLRGLLDSVGDDRDERGKVHIMIGTS
jgi:hypothetical protein